MKILLLSAYAARSHLHWQSSLVAMFPGFRWQCLTLPPRHFAWRVRGNPLYWSLRERDVLQGDYDLLVATSMVDLATLRGLVPALSRLPTLLYFHENQFAYPAGESRHGYLEAQMVSLYAGLAADGLAFNSAYNRDSFLDGASALLRRLPDYVPGGIGDAMQAKSEVLPVPVVVDGSAATGVPGVWEGVGAYPGRPLRLLWVGRFEHDKGAGRLPAILTRLQDQGIDFELALIGQQFRRAPPVFETLNTRFRRSLVHAGNLPERADLHTLMGRADIVLSTALHEFQGLAVMEAVCQGCVPVVPDRLAYREIYPAAFRYTSALEDEAAEARAAAQTIVRMAANLAAGEVMPPVLGEWSVEALRPRYQGVFERLAGKDSRGLGPV